MEYVAVEGLTKGLEGYLPNGHSFNDKYGYFHQVNDFKVTAKLHA
jgi:hypothetical protein